MLAVIWSDVTHYTIPNWLVGFVLLCYPAAIFMAHAPVDWKMAIAAFGVVLAGGYIVFAMKWMGAGDIKLLAACALWVGWGENLLDFIYIVALLGGALAIGLWGGRKLIPFLPVINKIQPLPRILRQGEPAAYGVAIAIGFLVMMWQGKLGITI